MHVGMERGRGALLATKVPALEACPAERRCCWHLLRGARGSRRRVLDERVAQRLLGSDALVGVQLQWRGRGWAGGFVLGGE